MTAPNNKIFLINSHTQGFDPDWVSIEACSAEVACDFVAKLCQPPTRVVRVIECQEDSHVERCRHLPNMRFWHFGSYGTFVYDTRPHKFEETF